MNSLRTSIPTVTCPHTSSRTEIRSDPHIHARPLNHRRQPRPLRHDPARNRLERRLRLVHGRDERSNHGRVHASTKVPSQVLEDNLQIGQRIWSGQLLQ
jgi:hypothetical protein